MSRPRSKFQIVGVVPDARDLLGEKCHVGDHQVAASVRVAFDDLRRHRLPRAVLHHNVLGLARDAIDAPGQDHVTTFPTVRIKNRHRKLTVLFRLGTYAVHDVAHRGVEDGLTLPLRRVQMVVADGAPGEIVTVLDTVQQRHAVALPARVFAERNIVAL